MSSRDFFSEQIFRAKVSALALAIGACIGAAAGTYTTVQPGARAAAVAYMVGAPMQRVGLCAFRAFGEIPHPCQVAAAIDGVLASPEAAPYVHDLAYEIANAKKRILHRWIPYTAIGAAFGTWLLLAFRNLNAWHTRPDTTEEHIRGAETVAARRLNKIARRKRGKGNLKVGPVTVPRAAENEHFLVSGGTGRGKTVAITGVLDTIQKRGDRVIIADHAGVYLTRYGLRQDRDDRILNPLDARALPWSPFAELNEPTDADLVALALIPNIEGRDGQWNRHAQTFMSALLLRGYAAGWKNRDLLYHALEADMDQLRKVLAGTPATGLALPGNERMFGSVRGTVTAYVGGLRYCDPDAGKDAESLRTWATTSNGWAFFNYQHDQLAAIGPLAGAMLDLIMTGMLSQKPNLERRTWLVLDELAAIGKINGLEKFLTTVRQFGGCVIVGIQSVAQVRKLYGRDTAETMLGNLSNQLIFSGSDPDTVRYLSNAIGEEEVRRRTPSASKADHGTNATWSDGIQVVASVLASEIAQLPTRHCFLRVSGGFPVAQVCVPLPPRVHDRAERFMPRDFSRLWTSPPMPAGCAPAVGDTTDLPDFGSNDFTEAT